MRNFNSAFSHVINYISVIPFLYRYENQNHIDTFFETGDLLISSFHNYKKYKDNELGDRQEGSSMNLAKIDNDMTLGTYVTTGMNEYSFCTSTIFEKSLLTTFSRNSLFRIKDPLNFILEVTRSIQRVHQVIHGHCLYLDQRMLTKNISGVDMESLKSEEGGISFEKLIQISNYVQGMDAYFLKQKKYQHQSEYRILWQTDREVKDSIIINCPEAIKYCEKVEIE
jgi:hypothetical protein